VHSAYKVGVGSLRFKTHHIFCRQRAQLKTQPVFNSPYFTVYIVQLSLSFLSLQGGERRETKKIFIRPTWTCLWHLVAGDVVNIRGMKTNHSGQNLYTLIFRDTFEADSSCKFQSRT
jgi:hypothetical protein